MKSRAPPKMPIDNRIQITLCLSENGWALFCRR